MQLGKIIWQSLPVPGGCYVSLTTPSDMLCNCFYLRRHLHHENKPNGDRLDTFSRVYKNLTGKDIVFEFPASH